MESPEKKMQVNESPGSANAAPGGFVYVDSKWAVLALVLAGMSFMGTIWSIHEATRAQTRADLLQLEVESFKNVLHEHHLPTTSHLPGEAP